MPQNKKEYNISNLSIKEKKPKSIIIEKKMKIKGKIKNPKKLFEIFNKYSLIIQNKA